MSEKASNAEKDSPEQPITASRAREFLAFLKTARNFKSDLSALPAPPFLLSSTSLVEYPTYYADCPSHFIKPSSIPDQTARALTALRWYLLTLRAYYGKREGRKKKPLNPFLGELFLAHIDDPATGRTEFVTEQVSHHPPVTAYRIWNEAAGVRLDGFHLQKTAFRGGSPRMERVGFVILTLEKWDEQYLFTLPSMYLVGLFPPPPYAELDGRAHMVGSNGLMGEIEFSGKGWLRGKKNHFSARLYHEDRPENELGKAEGQWQGSSFTLGDADGKQVERLDTAGPEALLPLTLAPLEKQDPLESRKAWKKVRDAIDKGEMSTISREKNTLEEEQRALRKTELAEGRIWESRYFESVDSWEEAEMLLAKAGKRFDKNETKGFWRWKGTTVGGKA